MQRTRVKICGLTSAQDALKAAELGADAIGLVFYSKSTRAVTPGQAVQICSTLPALVSVVGLFVNPSEAEVETTLKHVHLDCLQFHGDESAAFCGSFGIPYMKAIRVRPDLDVIRKISEYSNASAILLDSYDKNSAGGTGIAFDWQIAQRCVQEAGVKIVLAGGLSADNVAEAIRLVGPYAVDVSSGVESAPGLKSAERMSAFFNEVYSV
ncbi:MAG: phosphoribosylanthranilate isomerase [Gammaproteobacteria bacterium]|nr:phosphoribosylanthranilate isomerase [Gammaproteobacteria bacterium]MDP2139224.1 phosphoribosylanthranilate isomerase [Gammaproteobacteria bacterium]MDP2349007.1 phosphoribosylanthranilate isomerase [Gammaproteobacteria bacterium]